MSKKLCEFKETEREGRKKEQQANNTFRLGEGSASWATCVPVPGVEYRLFLRSVVGSVATRSRWCVSVLACSYSVVYLFNIYIYIYVYIFIFIFI